MSETRDKRAEVARRLISTSANIKGKCITKISTSDLKLLFDLYDEIFFDNQLKKSFGGKIKFSLSSRMTRSAGKTFCPKNIDKINPDRLVIEIRMATDFFFEYDEVEGDKTVCGLATDSALEA